MQRQIKLLARLCVSIAVFTSTLKESALSIPQVLAQTPSPTKVEADRSRFPPYSSLQQVLIAQNKPDAALLIAELGRARAFIEPMAGRSEPNITNQSAINPPTIEQIKQVAKQHKATLVEYSISYDPFRINGEQVDKESELLIWVIQPTGEIALRRVDLKPLWQKQNISLSDLVNSSRRERIGVRGGSGKGMIRVEIIKQEDSQNKSLQQLHQLLIEPIADLLPADPNARVIFIPQKSLFLLSFAALQDKSGKYLIEKHTLGTAPSIQILDLLYHQQQRIQGVAKNVLVVGNPTMPSISPKIGEPPQQLPSLPGAEQEALAIARLYNTQALTGKEATKPAVMKRLPQARIIHLATNTLVDDFQDAGVPGAIALAPSGNDNGLLSAKEIMGMKLSAELVVLSGSDSAKGRITSDGAIGLTRSFMVAGVPSAIGSLWSVSDAATAFLMIEFYRNLQQNPDKASALRQAMLATMKKHPNPQYWAAFTLVGEP